MRHLNGRYAQRFNRRHGWSGHVFAQRYSAYVIRDARHLEQACAYIAANPVKAGLCETDEDWPWTWIGDESSSRVPVSLLLRSGSSALHRQGQTPRGLSLQ